MADMEGRCWFDEDEGEEAAAMDGLLRVCVCVLLMGRQKGCHGCVLGVSYGEEEDGGGRVVFF